MIYFCTAWSEKEIGNKLPFSTPQSASVPKKVPEFPPEVHVGIVLLAKTFAVNHPFLRMHQPAWSGCRNCSMHQPGFPAQLFGYFEDPAVESDVYGKEESDECISNLFQNELTHSAHGHKVKKN